MNGKGCPLVGKREMFRNDLGTSSKKPNTTYTPHAVIRPVDFASTSNQIRCCAIDASCSFNGPRLDGAALAGSSEVSENDRE